MYKDPERKKEVDRLRGIKRRAYFREYRRLHPQPYKYHKSIYKSHGSSIGYQGEELALRVLVGSKKIRKPCDLSWEGKFVDVKTSKPTLTNRGTYRWKFLLAKQKHIANLYLLIRKGLDDKVIDIYLVPNPKRNNLSFNENTSIKYKKYLLSL